MGSGAGVAPAGAGAAAPRAGRGALSWPSTIQMLPSRSTEIPWGKIARPAPKLLTSLPVASNFSTGSRFDVRQLLVPQRSPTQTLTPSLSISTELVDPHVRPSGSLAQPSIVL